MKTKKQNFLQKLFFPKEPIPKKESESTFVETPVDKEEQETKDFQNFKKDLNFYKKESPILKNKPKLKTKPETKLKTFLVRYRECTEFSDIYQSETKEQAERLFCEQNCLIHREVKDRLRVEEVEDRDLN